MIMKDRVVIITGAGGGIGRSHALRFARQGARVVVNDIGVGVESGEDGSRETRPIEERDPAVADRVVAEIQDLGGEAVADHSDVSTFAGGEALVEKALASFGRVDTLINNAGTLTTMSVGELDEKGIEKELAVHIVGYLGTIQAVWEPMKQQGGGTIVTTGSGFGGVGPGLVAYNAAKAGVFTLMRDVALQGAEHGIRCNSLVPAARTRMAIPYWGSEVVKGWDLDWASTLALFLASDLSDGITGRQFSVIPGNVLREWRVGEAFLEDERDWTPERIAERIGELTAS